MRVKPFSLKELDARIIAHVGIRTKNNALLYRRINNTLATFSDSSYQIYLCKLLFCHIHINLGFFCFINTHRNFSLFLLPPG